ncbi:alanine dehydrogenase [Halogranum gelatinilyticum]|uniref:Alanine dehydrogenase n=1 Tax=Halogranum gelatinilyticum TaxID=660521 RepID=A0A1H0A4F8_9EURY|nr:ornithine cyclodeaminase family protein [Halogranum gelatinilyticum]SDN28345.1 alanine dehydrogenase [Halogranum gelatinilyticum]
MLTVLSDDDVASLLDLDSLLPVVERAFLAQGRGEVERPDRPHFPVGTGLDGDEPLGTALTMPAYIHGAQYVATKLASVHEGNESRGLPTVNATIALSDAATGLPAAYMAGTRVTNARTGCIGGLAARELANVDGEIRLGVVGSGTQARWQARAVAAAVDVGEVRVYSRSDAREACAADLRAAGLDATAVDTAEAAVSDASVVVTATTSTRPVFDGDALAPGAVVVAVGAYTAEMRELDTRTVERAARLFADVPEEAAATGDFPETDAASLIPLSDVFEGRAGRERSDEILVVASVGSAVLDAATAEQLLDRAETEGVGTTVSL